MEISARTSVGRVRTLNEDAYFFSQPKSDTVFAVVADGMGGHNAGEVASSKAVEIVQKDMLEKPEIDAKQRLKSAIDDANREIFEMSLKANNLSGMGTTITACIAEGKNVTVAQVGDSRLYQIRKDSIKQITQDHSLVEMLIQSGEITKEQARVHPQKNVITRAIGTDKTVESDLYSLKAKRGDILLLCSDGLITMLEDHEIFGLIQTAETLETAAENLVAAAENAGGVDNITVILIRF